MATMNEANRDKTKVPDFFVMFRLSVLLLNSMSKLIHNRCTCKLVITTLRLQTCMQTETNNCIFFYVLRAILCNNQTKWEMKNFDPPLKFAWK